MTEHGHIGDGVYVSDDGYQIWLAANDHHNKVIALEPVMFFNLVRLSADIFDSKQVAKLLRGIADEVDPGDV